MKILWSQEKKLASQDNFLAFFFFENDFLLVFFLLLRQQSWRIFLGFSWPFFFSRQQRETLRQVPFSINFMRFFVQNREYASQRASQAKPSLADTSQAEPSETQHVKHGISQQSNENQASKAKQAKQSKANQAK